MTRLLTIMGSGETAPTMVKVHRSLLARVGGGPAVLLDTPYGFQENADDITARAQEYFVQSVGTPIGVATWRSADLGPLAEDTALAAVRLARYVFAGPGSPTYTLRQWRDGALPDLLAQKLAPGGEGAVTFASAAALTLGLATVPVYEIYKAGHDPHWLDGLGLFEAATGLRAAVVPHYDNAEGGHHDTRFCYLGERRLSRMVAELPDDAFVLGIDEHTAVVFDLDAGTVEVAGLGVLSVRAHGRTVTWPSGTTLDLGTIRAAASGAAPTAAAASATGASTALAAGSDPEQAHTGMSPLLAEAARVEAAFDAALAARDVDAAVAAVLELDRVIVDWSRDTLTSDEPDRVRTVLRSMVVRLGDLARTGAREPREVVGPFVGLLLDLRTRARAAKDFATSDAVRDGLVAAGVEVRDGPEGTEWHLGA